MVRCPAGRPKRACGFYHKQPFFDGNQAPGHRKALRVSHAVVGHLGRGRDEVVVSHPAVCVSVRDLQTAFLCARGAARRRPREVHSVIYEPICVSKGEHVLSMPAMDGSEPYESGDYLRARNTRLTTLLDSTAHSRTYATDATPDRPAARRISDHEA